MTRVLDRAAIAAALADLDLVGRIEAGFAAYSAGRCNVPPVGELLMETGEVHIKYGCVTGDPTYLVKIASGFPGNPVRGLPTGNGVMLIFSQETGALETVLLDEGHLTDLRTAVAGAVAARLLAPPATPAVGILGTGIQARLQARELRAVVACRDLVLYGRDASRRAACRADLAAMGFVVRETDDPAEVARACRLIVTTTSAEAPLLSAADIRPGTHVSAMGSDTPAKQELDPAILARAARVIVDSRPQALLRGEAHRALAVGAIDASCLDEIGEILLGRKPGRRAADEITIFDSTGLAVQDIAIAAAVAERATAAPALARNVGGD
jgi:ornithine cyclodeaminase